MQEMPPRQRRSQRNQNVRRAQYPDEQQSSYPEYPEYPSYNQPLPPSYPQGNYQQPPYQQSAPQYQQPYQQNPYQRPEPYQQPYQQPPRFASNHGGQPPYQNADDRPYRRSSYEGSRRSHDGLWLLLTIVCILILVGGGFMVSSLYGRYPAFQQKRARMNKDTFMNGLHVDGLHIGGLTMDEARKALENSGVLAQNFTLSVNIDGKVWNITQNELPMQRNLDEVLSEAYAIGRQGTLDTLQNGLTPFESRYRTMQAVNQSGAYLYTEVTYDRAKVRELANKLAGFVNVPAVNAQIYSFDFASRGFQFQVEQTGRELDSEKIYQAIIARLDQTHSTSDKGTVSLSTAVKQPDVTVAALQKSFGLVSAYTTTTLAGYNRNKNIEIACKAVTKAVDSGAVFSFNEATGFRSVDKGYLPAGAIAQGASVDEVGGGVCQVSSTMFNAAAMAGLEIVSSSPHAWPSTYVDPGRDATVDWQSWQSLSSSLDFKFKNTSDYPVFIVAYLTGSNYNKQLKCTVEIYGVALKEGMEIRLVTDLVSTTPAPTDVERVLNTELPYGEEKEVRKARPGYVYDTYRVYYQNGAEIYREKLRRSTYRTYTQKIEYNY